VAEEGTVSPLLVTLMFQLFMMNMRRRYSSSFDSEDCEEPSLVETGKENSDNDTECYYYSRLYTGQKRQNGSNAQNASIGTMKSFQVQQAGKSFFRFSETLNKCAVRLCNTFTLIFRQLSFSLIKPLINFFDFPSILMQ
jgi:hypothetical protein